MSTEPKGKTWVFSATPCPRCKGYNTEATHTDADRGIQYRKCRVPICRRPFAVRGKPVQPPEENQESTIKNQTLACRYCGKSYVRQADLTKHINRNHAQGETNDGQ